MDFVRIFGTGLDRLPYFGVYILPFSEEHHEALQWMLAELPVLKGEGLLVKADSIEPLEKAEIVALFNEQRQPEYKKITKKIDELSGRIRNLRKGGKDKKSTSLFRQFEKIQAEFQTVQQRDFFRSEPGKEMAVQIHTLRNTLEELTASEKVHKNSASTELPHGQRVEDFSGLTWVTRKRPFVDRMASAWLIRRLIDPKEMAAAIKYFGSK
jgi:hypothetical protein